MCAKELVVFFFSFPSRARDYHWQNRVSWKCSLMWYDAPSIIKFWTLLLRPIYSFVWKITQMKFAWLETESKWATTIESLRLESSFSLSWTTVMHLYWWTHPKGSYNHRHETFHFFPAFLGPFMLIAYGIYKKLDLLLFESSTFSCKFWPIQWRKMKMN